MLTVKQSQKKFIKLLFLFIAIVLPWIIGIVYVNKVKDKEKERKKNITLINYKQDTLPRVDHTRFEILQQDFENPKEVTSACLSCHNLTHEEIMKTSHWNWTKEYVTNNGDTIQLGKKNIINKLVIFKFFI